MDTSKNVRWTETYARKVLERARRRNLNDSALARELGVSPQRVRWWRKRLQNADASQTPASSQTPAFAEVTLAAPAAHPFAVHARSGHTIEVWPGFDAAELARLLAAVEGTPC